MDSVQVHIDSYNEENHSLVVHFTGMYDGVEYTTEKYAFSALAYNPSLVASVLSQSQFSIDDVVKQLARIGAGYLQQLVNKQQIADNPNWLNNIKALSNTSHTVSGSDLNLNNTPVNTDMVDNLEIVL